MQISVNFVQTVLVVEALMQREELEFTAEDLLHVSSQWEFPAGKPDPFSIPRHRGYVLGRPILPLFQIRGPGPRPRSSFSEEVSDLFEGTSAELQRLLEEAEGESSGSSESSSSSWDGNEEIMAPKVRTLWKGQAPRIEPPMLPEAPDLSMLVPAEDQSITPSSMAGAGSATGNPELWAPQFTSVELGKQVTSADTSKDYETCVALGNAVMLPQDVTNHAAETTTEFGGKLVMLGAQASAFLFQRAVSTSLRLKQGTMDLKKANQKANNLEKELKLGVHMDRQSPNSQMKRSTVEIATLQWNQAQQEASDLKAFACGEVYKKLFDRAFERAGDVYERLLAELRSGIFQEG
ncbi:hypothetical protein Acr_25g0001480 [Actinidia rufa]|uniref:Uncharacterized protein n=1 Tax=Actinidia rufa TaxID=165716 RepID=A0A7J0GY37_9ERIC|nr:hypothetical protein Acr_25g0001480 [Actinidia rufa]